MDYLTVVRMMKQAAMEVANPKEAVPAKPAIKPDPKLVGTVRYKDPNTGKMVVEHPVRGARQAPARIAPIKKPMPAAKPLQDGRSFARSAFRGSGPTRSIR